MNTANLEQHLNRYTKQQLIKLFSQLFSEYRVMKKSNDPIADIVAYFGEGVITHEDQ